MEKVLFDRLQFGDLARHSLLVGGELVEAAHHLLLTSGDPVDALPHRVEHVPSGIPDPLALKRLRPGPSFRRDSRRDRRVLSVGFSTRPKRKQAACPPCNTLQCCECCRVAGAQRELEIEGPERLRGRLPLKLTIHPFRLVRPAL